jgi:hypothetical protein
MCGGAVARDARQRERWVELRRRDRALAPDTSRFNSGPLQVE